MLHEPLPHLSGLAHVGSKGRGHFTAAPTAHLAGMADEAAKLPPDVTEKMIILARDDIRRAWIKAVSLSDKYRTVRAAYDSLNVAPGDDTAAEFVFASNVDEVWPRPKHRNIGSQTPPWPTTDPQFLLWAVRSGLRLIVPTAAKRQRLWETKYAEQIEQQKLNRLNAQAYGALLGA